MGDLDPVPRDCSDYPSWQNGVGNSSSESRRNLGSIVLDSITPGDSVFKILHLFLMVHRSGRLVEM